MKIINHYSMKNIIYKIAGLFYKSFVVSLVSYINKKISSKIPRVDLNNKHLNNAILLENRKELLKRLKKNGVVAELGVDKGDFSKMILDLAEPKKLHLIDFWGSKRYNQQKRRNVEMKFSESIIDKSVEINLGFSTEVVNLFPVNYFDWIYIDTDHSYKTTIQELELYREKVKENGVIAGHDYITGNWDMVVRYGVIEAVHEFCQKYNWEIIFLTSELTTYPSFAIRRIRNT